LPFGFASHAPFSPFSISNDKWKKIEKRYVKIPPELRHAVVASVQRMRNRSEAWKSALPIRETDKQIAGIKRAAVDWLKSTDGLPPEIEAMIMSVEKSEQAERVINPFMKGIVAACDEGLAYLGSMKAEDARHPWENWIVELTKLFKQHGLPTSAPKDVDKAKPGQRPSKFVIFIRELQQLIEPQYCRSTAANADDPDKADAALADAITRARAPRKDRSAARKRQVRASGRTTFGGQNEDPPPNRPRTRRR
jgi:hypothetical protein